MENLEKLIQFINKENANENCVNNIIKSNRQINELNDIKGFFSNKNSDEFIVEKLYSIIIYLEKLIFEEIRKELKVIGKELTE